MAADQLDKLWSGWMADLSTSHAACMVALKAGDPKKAGEEFRTHFEPTVKKLFSEAATVYPARFAKVDDWCAWSRELYTLTRQTSVDFEAGSVPEAEQGLTTLRAHFDRLHTAAAMRKANDVIYGLQEAAQKSPPDIAAMKTLRAELDQAPPSADAQAKAEQFAAAKAAWEKKVGPALRKGKAGCFLRGRVKKATHAFYDQFGRQFE